MFAGVCSLLEHAGPMSALRGFRWVSFAEGISFLVLVGIAMPLKHAFDMPMAVRVVGAAHGALFLVFLVALFRASTEEEWGIARSAKNLMLSVVPFGFVWIERGVREDLARMEQLEPAQDQEPAP